MKKKMGIVQGGEVEEEEGGCCCLNKQGAQESAPLSKTDVNPLCIVGSGGALLRH